MRVEDEGMIGLLICQRMRNTQNSHNVLAVKPVIVPVTALTFRGAHSASGEPLPSSPSLSSIL